ncbi:MAG: hypothetical protein RML36_01670 [Anaerolineae bacterium]|nr:hypothetical protein [Anaerolineae bacterium]
MTAIIREKLRFLDQEERLTTAQALEITNEIAELAQAAAKSLETAGEFAAIVGLYEDVAKAFEKAAAKMPEQDQDLIAPFMDFWSRAAESKRVALSTPPASPRASLPFRPEALASAQLQPPKSGSPWLKKQKGTWITRDHRDATKEAKDCTE